MSCSVEPVNPEYVARLGGCRMYAVLRLYVGAAARYISSTHLVCLLTKSSMPLCL